MKALTAEESRDYLLSKNLIDEGEGESIQNHSYFLENGDHLFFQNEIFRRTTTLVEELKSEKAFCFFDQYGVWPFVDDPFTQKALWSSLNSPGVFKHPVLYFDKCSVKHLPSYVAFAFHSSWDCTTYFDEDNWIEFSHDGWIRWTISCPGLEDLFAV